MSEKYTYAGNMGRMTIDFSANTVSFERNAMLQQMGFIPMEFKIGDITAIEVRRPSFFKLGAVSFIIKGIRYMRKNGQFGNTEFVFNNKGAFEEAQPILWKIVEKNNLGDFKPENSVSAAREIYVPAAAPAAQEAAPAQPAPAPAAPAQAQGDPLDAIKKLKELLDMGLISQDEFDAKKKQILGL